MHEYAGLSSTQGVLTHFPSAFQVHHFFEAAHSQPNIRILSPSDTATVQEREDPDALANMFSWTCNRCAQFFPEFVEGATVPEHLQIK